MSDSPKFEVIDRRKIKAKEERESNQGSAAPASTPPAQPPAHAQSPSEPAVGPHLVVNEPRHEDAAIGPEQPQDESSLEAQLPPPPTVEESREQKSAYDASAQRLEDLIRAQNPAAGPQPPVSFEQLVQQFYVTAMLQMGAGTQEGQRPRIDIVGARSTVDLLGVLADKTRGNLTPAEDRMLQTVLFEARMAFLEITSMMTVQPVVPPPPAKK